MHIHRMKMILLHGTDHCHFRQGTKTAKETISGTKKKKSIIVLRSSTEYLINDQSFKEIHSTQFHQDTEGPAIIYDFYLALFLVKSVDLLSAYLLACWYIALDTTFDATNKILFCDCSYPLQASETVRHGLLIDLTIPLSRCD